MVSLQVVLLDLEKSVQCAICLGSLKVPVTTRCNHNFCNECIRKALKNKVEIPCPLCKKFVRIRSLKKAVHLHSLINVVHKVTNQVQKVADIPYTLSQSTREETVNNNIDLDHNENEVLRISAINDNNESHLNCNGQDTMEIVNDQINEDPHCSSFQVASNDDKNIDARSSATKKSRTENVGQECDMEITVPSNVNCGMKHTSDIVIKGPQPNVEPEKMSLNKTTEVGNTVTVAVDVHFSPLISQVTGQSTQMPVLAKQINAVSKLIQQLPTIKLNGNMNGSAISSSITEHSEISEINQDPFAFPLSQNHTITNEKTKKRNHKKPPKKALDYAMNKKRKSSPSENPKSKRQKKSPRASSETDASSMTALARSTESEESSKRGWKKKLPDSSDKNAKETATAMKMIKEVEHHHLTVERTQASKNEARKKIKQCSENKKKDQVTTPSKNRNQAITEKNNLQGECPQLVRRLLSTSSSSSDSENARIIKSVIIKEQSSQKSVNDKVNDWLETATGSTTGSDVHNSPVSKPRHNEALTSDDDLISHSQVSVEHIPDRVLILKRRKFSSPVKLDPAVQQSVRNQLWNRDKEVFGLEKPKNTFLAKNRKNLAALWVQESSTSSDDGRSAEKISKIKHGSRPRKKKEKPVQTIYVEGKEPKKNQRANTSALSPNKESIYDVQGLSQGVSPFSSPVKNPESPEKAYVLLDPTVLKNNVISTKSSSDINLLKESVNEMILNETTEDYDIKDANTTDMVDDTEKDTSQGLLQDITERCALEASAAFLDIVCEDNIPGASCDIVRDDSKASVTSSAGHELQLLKKYTEAGINAQEELKEISDEQPEVNFADCEKQMKIPATPTRSSSQGRKVRKTPVRPTKKSVLPLVGDSPTILSTGKSIETTPTPRVSVPGVELGLLDFSEVLVMSPKSQKTENNSVERPEAVAKTCRMVLQSLGELGSIKLKPVDSVSAKAKYDITGSRTKKQTKSRSKRQTTSEYETDDSAIPPSTSTADIPTTPPMCHLTEAIHPSIESTTSEVLQISSKDVLPDKSTVSDIDIKSNNNNNNESKLLVTENGPGEVMALGDHSCATDDGLSATDEETDRMQCLSNGWGGTKLRIFKSASSADVSDSNSNSSFSLRKRIKGVVRGASGSKVMVSATDKDVTLKGQHLDSDLIAQSVDMLETPENSIPQSGGKTFTYSVDIIPNSDIITENKTIKNVRKSSRKNKGQNTSFDYITPFHHSKTKKEKPPVQVPDSSTVEKTIHSPNLEAQNTNVINPVLLHIEAAIADADISFTNWREANTKPENHVTSSSQASKEKVTSSSQPSKEKTPKKVSQSQPQNMEKYVKQQKTKEKVNKTISSQKILPIKRRQHIPTGKRTKQNVAKFDDTDRKTSSADEMKIHQSNSISDDDYFNRSWPLEWRRQETFSCSLPYAVPKHITDVSVRLERISKSQNENSNPDEVALVKILKEKEIDLKDDLIEASPMLFETQHENDVERSSGVKNTHGRSLNIDLREMMGSKYETKQQPDEIDFIHDDTDYVENEADDVICCSWNEEVDNQAQLKSASCHEDTSSIHSSEPRIGPEIKSDNLDVVDADTNVNDTEKSTVDENIAERYYKTVIEAIDNICNLDKKKLLEQFPRSSIMLYEAIALCGKAKIALDTEFLRDKLFENETKENDSTNTVIPQPNSAQIETTQPKLATVPKRKRGRPRKSTNSQPNYRPEKVSPVKKSIVLPKKISSRIANKIKEKADFIAATDNNLESRSAEASGPKITPPIAKSMDVEVDKEWQFDEDEDMAMFDEIDDVLEDENIAADANEIKETKDNTNDDDEIPSTSKEGNEYNAEQDYLSASLEEAMLETEMETSKVYENNSTSHVKTIVYDEEFDDDNLDYMSDIVNPTPKSPQKDDLIFSSPNAENTDVVADKVDKWLRRLSDLNKKEGAKQKRKIGEKWARSGDEQSSGASNSASELLRKSAMLKGKAKSDNESAASDRVLKFMNELDRESDKTDSPASKMINRSKRKQEKTSSFEENSLQHWLDTSTDSDQNDLKKLPLSPGNGWEDEDNQPGTSKPKKYQSIKSPKTSGKQKEPLHIVSQPKVKASPYDTFNNDGQSDQSQGLKFVRTPNKFSDNIYNTKVVLKKLEILNHGDVTYNSSPTYRDAACVDSTPKVERWLESAQPEAASPPAFDSPEKEKLGIVTSGLQEKGNHLVKKFAKKYSGHFYSTFDEEKVTHVVMRATEQRSCDRTLKYLQGIAAEKWIVSWEWVRDSLERDEKLPEDDYEVIGDNCMKEFESDDHDIPQGPMRSRTSADDFKLLRNYRCVCLPPFNLILPDQAAKLLKMCGATVADHLGDLITNDENKSLPDQQRIIIVDVEVSSNPPDYIAMSQQFGATVVSLEWVYESISRFEVQPPDEYTVTGFTQDSEMVSS